jgi:hypothetical protein
MNRRDPEDFLRLKRKISIWSINKVLIILALFLIVAVPIIEIHIVAKGRIHYIAFTEIGNETNQTLLINKILEWEKDNIVDLNMKENENYSCIRIPDGLNPLLQNSYLISLTRCGKCGEFAEMFSELANEFGIKNRIIDADNINGGNHAWVEIIIGNTTIPIDTTSLDGYNASQFYNCKFLIQYRNIHVRSFWAGEDISRKYYSWCS